MQHDVVSNIQGYMGIGGHSSLSIDEMANGVGAGAR